MKRIRSARASRRRLARWDGAARGLEALEGRVLLSVNFVADINQVASSPVDLTPSGSNLFFVVNDPTQGQVLWVTDGTPQDTHRITTIHSQPGFYTANPNPLVSAGNGKIYFPNTNAAGDTQLWVSDGTLNGTLPVTSANAGHGGMTIDEVVLDSGTYTAPDMNGMRISRDWPQGLRSMRLAGRRSITLTRSASEGCGRASLALSEASALGDLICCPRTIRA